MEKLYSISQAAKIVNLTTETLRHYDRIGLVKPTLIDKESNYRYYSDQDIVRLNTVKALAYMDISLKEIKEILSYKDFERIIEALKEAEKKANLKINELKNAKARIKRARTFYESKLQINESSMPFIKEYKERKILLSSLTSPTIDNLYNYHRHFFNELPENINSDFSFKDLAGIYEENNQKQMFAECITYKDTPLLKTLPSGKYLCINAKESELEKAQNTLINIVKEKFNHEVKFIVKLIILKDILSWDYEVQVLYE